MTQRRKRHSAARTQYRKVLVVWKRSYLMEVHAKNDRRTIELIEQRHPSLEKVIRSNSEHQATLTAVTEELQHRRVAFKAVFREDMEEELASGAYDLVITVGGDGTALDASHNLADNVPVLGVNSALSSSHGHFCVANINNFAKVLGDVLQGRRKPISVMRLQLLLDGQPIAEPVLNEVFIAHSEIGATSRYIVTAAGRSEEHKSDGFFVGTPSGCSGWMRSYHGEILPITSRYVQYLTRGLIVPPGQLRRFERGLLAADPVIKVVSDMPDGRIFVDGRHIKYAFERGSELIIKPATHDLRLFADANANDRYATGIFHGGQASRH